MGSLCCISLLTPADVIFATWTSSEKESCRMHRRAGDTNLVGTWNQQGPMDKTLLKGGKF